MKVVIAGSGGRMGQALIEATLADPALQLAGALEVPGSPLIGRDAGERSGRASAVRISTNVRETIEGADVLIDFTRPAGTLAHVRACADCGVGAVVGTTGLSDDDKRTLAELAGRIPIVFAPNMSVGITVMLKLVAMAAQSLGDDYDIEVVEMHHKHKIDAPSGTALRLGEAAAEATGRDLARDGVFTRHGETGERRPRTIGFATLRGGDVIGEHSVIFAGTGERLEISHRAGSRANFAHGALRAAKFVAARKSVGETGLYDMRDVLELR